MRLFCPDEHDDNLCPSGPVHDFSGSGWTTDEAGIGCFWCVRCGDTRQIMPASIAAPNMEAIVIETE